jgi:eukaryotic-like serine/threonine-protein kinase
VPLFPWPAAARRVSLEYSLPEVVLSDTLARLRTALAGRYRLERELRGGAMSRVFVATESSLGRQVVIKVLPPELAASLSADRFRREIQLAASLQHPHIVPLLAAGEAADLLFFTMPLVEGESLQARLARDGELPVGEATRVLRDVADALSYAHRHGVVHRDIKPGNVLLSDGHALVTDFGVAKALDQSRRSSLTSTGLALGTPTYMAPEQAAADPHTDHRADIYALGALGYELLSGRPPFTAPTAQAVVAAHLTQTPTPLAQLRLGVPPALAALVMRCLEKRPADRWQSAAEMLQAIEAVGAPPAAAAPGRTRRVQPAALAAAGIALAAALVGWLLLGRPRDAAPLDDDLVAIAPFDVPDQRLALWREGLVDVLSRNLDGAGPIRTVPSTTVIRRWSGRADPPSAGELGRRTGAGLVVFGTLIGAGPDSARLTVTALDIAGGRLLAEIELRDAADRMDRLADSLTVRLLRELGRTRRIEVFRATAMGSTSLPALKAFLRGEQWYRRVSWDSALAAYGQAISLDSNFALALWRSGKVLGWQHSSDDSVYLAQAMLAGALTHGLAPRDSLLLTADSVLAEVNATVPRWRWSALRRLHALAEELTRRYPDDAESWYVLGEARFHWGFPAGHTPAEALAAFDRAIRQDSAFAPSYIHAVALGFWLGGPEVGHRYATRYLALQPTDASVGGIRLADQLVGRSATPEEAGRLIRQASPQALRDAMLALAQVADSAETAVALSRALAAAPPGDAAWLGPADRQLRLGTALLFRGHVREAVRIIYQNPEALPVHLVETGLVARDLPDTAVGLFHRIAEGNRVVGVATTLPWWAARRDSAAIKAIERRTDSIARAAPLEVDRGIARYAADAARAYLALLRHDTATAVRRLEALPDSLCPLCYQQRITLGQLLASGRDDRRAAALLDRWLVDLTVPSAVIWALERARVAERLGERDTAVRGYQYVADVWRHADPELQTYVTEAKQGLARLTGEPRR